MTWAVRHEGSPSAVEGLGTEEVIQGLEDGLWEPTDEVIGPQDSDWTPLGDHPVFADAASELEPVVPRHFEEETRLDMNPLIDVCLVLLIFFILTTSYAALQRFFESPRPTQSPPTGPLHYTPKQLAETTIKVTAREENKKTVIRVEDKVVPANELVSALRRFTSDKRKNKMWLDIADNVAYKTEIQIRDAAKGAGIEKVLLQVERPGS
jgi:biopolymer transport protein ExbD